MEGNRTGSKRWRHTHDTSTIYARAARALPDVETMAKVGAIAGLAGGMMFGLVLEVVLVNLIVNSWQDVDTLYTSTREWSWWVAHGLFGATLGMVAAGLLRREGPARAVHPVH